MALSLTFLTMGWNVRVMNVMLVSSAPNQASNRLKLYLLLSPSDSWTPPGRPNYYRNPRYIQRMCVFDEDVLMTSP